MILKYCESCGLRMGEADLTPGVAVMVEEDRRYCADCAALREESPEAAGSANAETPAAGTASRARPDARTLGPSRKPVRGKERPSARMSMTLPLAVCGLLALALLIWFATTDRDAQPEKEEATPKAIASPVLPANPVPRRQDPAPKATEVAAPVQPRTPAVETPAPVPEQKTLAPAPARTLSGDGFPEVVSVGNPGNAADSTGFGAVAYEYKIGKYEVTNAEYCEFLNGVAKTNAHDLYDPRLGGEYGGISRSGSPGSFTYHVKGGWARKPVGYVTFHSCVRFCNWLSNGKGNGNTETGVYRISGNGIKAPDHAALAVGKEASWVISSENEWYKAAYFDPAKPGSPGYWPYAVKGGNAPEAAINSGGPSEVGAHASAASPYGTFDQNGNAWEYNETMVGDKVGLRGGSWYINDRMDYALSSTRYEVHGAKWPHYGFRVVLLGGDSGK